jgi:hypothetical protein
MILYERSAIAALTVLGVIILALAALTMTG